MHSYRPGELNPHIHVAIQWKEKARFKNAADSSPMWVLFVVACGSFHYEIENQAGLVEKGDLVLCPPGSVLSREMISPSTFLVLYFSWFADGKELRSTEWLNPNPTGKCTIRDKHRFASTYEYISMLTSRTDPLAKARRNFLLHDLWMQFDWEWESDRQQKQPLPDDPLMKQAASFLEENAFKPVSLNQLSAALGLSTVQFSRRFRRSFGVNPSEFLSELRLDKARLLLQENKLTLDEIAAHCGYSNGFYFSRVFSQKMRITPSEYRQAYRI